MERLVSCLGLLSFLGLAVLLCPARLRRRIPVRLVVLGTLLQFALAFVVLRTPARAFFTTANELVGQLLAFSQAGARFVFGSLVERTDTFGFIFAFQVLPTIVFLSALTAVLYTLGVLPAIVRVLGGLLARLLGVGQAEAVAAAANIFLGHVESPLIVRPYLRSMSASQLLAVMAPGLASVAGSVLVAYVGLLANRLPEIAGHLLAASFMSAPAALVTAKLLLPDDKPVKLAPKPVAVVRRERNLLAAAVRGTEEGLAIALGVGATLIAFVALVALANACLQSLAGLVGQSLTLEQLFGWLFAPCAWLMGVPGPEVLAVGNLLGQKLVLNEFVAFGSLAQLLEPGGAEISPRTAVIASYALCGFANFGSVAILVTALGKLAPRQRLRLAALGPRALVAGTLASFTSAAIVGVLL